MEPLPLSRAEALSVTVLDRNDRLLRAYTTPDGRWRLPVEVEGRRPALSCHAAGFRGQALPVPPRRRPYAIGRAAWLLVRHAAHRLRRLDADHAGGAPVAGRARALGRRQAAPGPARAGAGAASCPRTPSCASTSASRPSAATSKACARPRSPTSARSRGACRWRRRPSSSRCRSRPSCAGRTASPRPRGAPATACWPMPPRRASIPREEAARAMAERMPTVRREFPMLAPHLADAEVEQNKTRLVHRLTIDRTAAGEPRAAHPRARQRAGRPALRRADRRRPHDRRGDRPRRLARLPRRGPLRRRRYDERGALAGLDAQAASSTASPSRPAWPTPRR